MSISVITKLQLATCTGWPKMK